MTYPIFFFSRGKAYEEDLECRALFFVVDAVYRLIAKRRVLSPS